MIGYIMVQKKSAVGIVLRHIGYCIMLFLVALSCIVLALYGNVCVALYCMVLCCMTLYCIVLCCIVQQLYLFRVFDIIWDPVALIPFRTMRDSANFLCSLALSAKRKLKALADSRKTALFRHENSFEAQMKRKMTKRCKTTIFRQDKSVEEYMKIFLAMEYNRERISIAWKDFIIAKYSPRC